MTNPPAHTDPYELWDASYVLGSLTPSERREYEDHVAGCAQCRRQLAELSGIPGLLALLDSPATATAAAPAAGTTLVPYAVFAQKVRRRRAWMAGAAAAAVLAVVTGTAAVTANLSGGTSNPPTAISTIRPGALAAPGPAAGATTALHFASTGQTSLTATGALRAQSWGTTITWTCIYAASTGSAPLKPGYTAPAGLNDYELVVLSTQGTQTVVATWHADPGATVSPIATTNIPISQIKNVSIRAVGQEGILLNATP